MTDRRHRLAGGMDPLHQGDDSRVLAKPIRSPATGDDDSVEVSGLKALQAFMRTLTNWKERILNYFDGRHSNGFAEGINLKVKLINRRGFGYRNFENFRLHVLTAF